MILTIPQSIVNLKIHTIADLTSPAMNNVYFDKENNQAVATDGHTLFWIDINLKEIEGSFGLNRDDLKGIKFGCSLDTETKILEFPEDKKGSKRHKRVVEMSSDYKYPNYKQAIPKHKTVYRISLSSESLRRLSEMAKQNKNSRTQNVILSFSKSGLSPVMMDYKDNSGGYQKGLIMPCRELEQDVGLL